MLSTLCSNYLPGEEFADIVVEPEDAFPFPRESGLLGDGGEGTGMERDVVRFLAAFMGILSKTIFKYLNAYLCQYTLPSALKKQQFLLPSDNSRCNSSYGVFFNFNFFQPTYMTHIKTRIFFEEQTLQKILYTGISKPTLILPITVRPFPKYRGPRRGIWLHRGQRYCSLLPCCTFHLP